MSSESRDPKGDSAEPGPPSGTTTRLSARAPSAWGAVRDALAALHNLAALLRSSRVATRVILDLLPELRASAGVLRAVFGQARGGADDVTRDVGEQGVAGVTALDALLDDTGQGEGDRDGLALRARALADDLEACADLLSLLERAAEPAPTSVGVHDVLRETGRPWGSGRGAEIVVRFDRGPDATIEADPYVVGPLLRVLLGRALGQGASDVTVRVAVTGARVVLDLAPSTAGDLGIAAVSVRVMPAVAPADRAAHKVAACIQASLELAGPSATLSLPLSSG